jgi:hypothetical protein
MMISLSSWTQFDLSIEMTDPTNEMEFDSGASVIVDIELTNWEAILPEFDTLFLGFILNDVFYGPNTGVLTGASVAGGGVSFPIEDVVTFNDLDDGIYTLCAWIIGVGSVESGRNFDLSLVSHLEELDGVTILDVANGDPTPENNEHCIEIYVGDTSVVIVDDVSVGENEADQYKVYPNPASDQLTVEAPADGGQVTLSALNGEAVLTEFVAGKTELDLANIAPGMYILSLRGNDGILLKNEKVIVQP